MDDVLPFDRYFLNQPEPAKGCLLALKSYILDSDVNVTSSWKYRMPFFCYNGRMFCYLWMDKKSGLPYLGFVEGNRLKHPLLIQGERSRMKILLVNPKDDLPLATLNLLINKALDLYKERNLKL